MKKHIERIMAIEKIDRSITQCLTLEQLAATEHFLSLYYKQYAFDAKYFRYEWNMDSKLSNRRVHISLLEGIDEDDITLNPDKASLKRLVEFVGNLSQEELKGAWTELRPQLEGVDLSRFPVFRERVAVMRLNNQHRGKGKDLQDLFNRARHSLAKAS